jgi:predicted secreted hydrolase
MQNRSSDGEPQKETDDGRCFSRFTARVSAAIHLTRPVVLLILLVMPGFAAQASDDYATVSGPCHLTFPADHGAHPDYRTEWWYYTGNLTDENNDHFGFQLTFFRSRILSPGEEQKWPSGKSPWRTAHLFMAHAAISDFNGNRFYHAQKLARGAMGLAGAVQTHRQVQIFIADWHARIAPERHELQASAPQFSMKLTSLPTKPPILHGEKGYSRKGNSPDRASCYYSFTRMDTRGTVQIQDKSLRVKGNAWMDHEFSSAPLDPEAVGWDWFSLQFDDRTELMLYIIRQENGVDSLASSGTWITADAQTRHLPRSAFIVKGLDTWTSPHSKTRYPCRWQVTVPSLALDLTIAPNLPDQELHTGPTTGIIYWEGSVAVTGTRNGNPISGSGYVELTGYAGPFDAPL